MENQREKMRKLHGGYSLGFRSRDLRPRAYIGFAGHRHGESNPKENRK